MADSDSEWWEDLLVVEPAACSAPAPAPGPLLPDPVPVVESLLSVQSVRSMPPAPVPGQILQDPTPLVESLVSVQSVRSMPSAPAPAPILQDPVPIVESLLSVQSVCSMPSAPAPGPIFRDPVLQPTRRSTAILLPIAAPSLGPFILQSSRSIHAESLQIGTASAARTSADVVDALIRARCWQSLVLQASHGIATSSGVYLAMNRRAWPSCGSIVSMRFVVYHGRMFFTLASLTTQLIDGRCIRTLG